MGIQVIEPKPNAGHTYAQKWVKLK